MAGATRPVGGGAYSSPRSEPGGQNTPRAGRVVASYGTYTSALGLFAQQVDQGSIFDDVGNANLVANGSGVESSDYADSVSGIITASGSGVESYVYSDKQVQDTVIASGTGATASIYGPGTLKGYAADTDLTAVTLGTRFRVSAVNHAVVGVRVWPASNNLAGCWAFLLDSNGNILTRKAFPSNLVAGQWNTLLFDARYAIPVDATGYVAGIYMPSGGYAAKAHVFDGSDQVSGFDGHLYALGSSSAPNGVFDYQAITPASFAGPFVLNGFNNTHYGIDVLVFDLAAANADDFAYTDARTATATASGTGSESYVPSGDTTAPIPTVTVVDVTKISRVVGKDAVSVTFTTDEAFVEYEIRRVSSGSDPRGAGNQVETAVVSSRTSHLAVITDDELISAAASEGSNTLKIFVKDLAGNWST